ncbi:MAG: TGS domain-containing protein, partial [Candidatus Sumerlaeia bacterium]|nr:TGS domain-containing protein [Candidatus Sumerlaeia bacterium]
LYLYPEEAREIQRLLEQKQTEREDFVKRACDFLRTHLEQAGLKAEVTGRAKHIYSIYLKMKRQDVPLDGIYDLIAIRVITETEEECWTALGKIHSIWHPIAGTFNDYISMPKNNLYRSIHTTVVGLDGQPIEIQIRTREMHQVAEFGVAAHWRYKEGLSARPNIEDKLHWIRQLSEWVRELQDPSDFMSALKAEVFADTIFCFTPAGDVIALPKGSTPLDFAYQVHTQIGDKCSGAIVNKRMVPLRYELQNGDIVQIITSKDAHPHHDWLEIVRTSTARNKIRRYLRSQQYKEKIEVGKEILLKALRQQNINLSLEQVFQQLQGEYRKLNVRDAEHLLAEIGFGTLSTHAVLNLLPRPAKVETFTIPKTKPARAGKCSPGIVLSGVSSTTDINLRLARCCSPIAGEKIIGFITVGRGIAIHRRDCHYLQRVITENKPDKSRLVEANWYIGNDAPQTVTLRLIAWDRLGLLNEITGVISGMRINISGTKSKSYPGKKQAVIYIAVMVKNQDELNKLLKELSGVKGLISLSRVQRSW